MVAKKRLLAGISTILMLTLTYTAYGEASNYEELFEAGLSNYYKRDYVTAIANFKEAIEVNYESPRAYYYLGYTYYKLGEMKLAQDYFNKVYLIDPNYTPNMPVSGIN